MSGVFKIDTRSLVDKAMHEQNMNNNLSYRMEQEHFARNYGLMDISTGRMNEISPYFKHVPEIEQERMMDLHHSRQLEFDRQNTFRARNSFGQDSLDFKPVNYLIQESPRFEPIVPQYEPLPFLKKKDWDIT